MDADEAKSQPATSNASSGTKRKRAGPKFYAVKNGHRPGVYTNWNDCQGQVNGFKNAVFKSFSTKAEADDFIKPKDIVSEGKGNNAKVSKFYAVQNGLVPGVYTDWASCQKQTVGFHAAKYKAFNTRAKAEEFAKAGRPLGAALHGVSVDSGSPTDGADAASNKAPAAKKQRKSIKSAESTGDGEPGEGLLPEDAEDGFDPNITMDSETGKVKHKTQDQKLAKKKMPTGDLKSRRIIIYTDGSALGNGKKGATAGVGVFFGPMDERNVSTALAGPRQTNQRAELTAIQRALDIAPLTSNVEIRTDSRYSIDCVTNWIIGWKKKDWKTSAGKPVENRDLIEAIDGRMEERKKLGCETEFVWVKGHAEEPGNKAADELAVQGARTAMADAKKDVDT